MIKRNFVTWMSLAALVTALVCMFGQGRALAAYAPPAALATPDYFGYANYANSPLPTGPIAAITLSTGGSGYSASPTVTIADFNCSAVTCGSGATATATVSGGVITAITLNSPGSGYFAPAVTITDPTGKGAAATATLGTPAIGTGIRKFVDNLPLLCVPGTNCVTTGAANGLGQYIPIANPNRSLFTGADYYEIGLSDHNEQMHSDLPGTGYGSPTSTKIRGYYQINNGTLFGATDTSKHYLGPLIIATKNRPTRVKFVNNLGTGSSGNLFIPVDTTYMGAGLGADGVSYYTQNRATLHLHGGATPWISDGTPHQWVTPVGESSTNTPYLKGDSFQNVPDMAGPGSPIGLTNPQPNDGIGTFYWTNEQGGRLMFYHDHAYGLTRLNVYAGEAAGYLLVDPAGRGGSCRRYRPGDNPQHHYFCRRRSGTPGSSGHPGQDFCPFGRANKRPGPYLEFHPLQQHRRPLVPPCLHTESEPDQPCHYRRGQPVRPVGLRSLVLPAANDSDSRKSANGCHCPVYVHLLSGSSIAMPHNPQPVRHAGGVHGYPGDQRHSVSGPQRVANSLSIPDPGCR